MNDYLSSQGQVLIMCSASARSTPQYVVFLTSDGKTKDWEVRSWESFADECESYGYDEPMTFLIAYSRRHMLNLGISRFEVVVCNVSVRTFR